MLFIYLFSEILVKVVYFLYNLIDSTNLYKWGKFTNGREMCGNFYTHVYN